MKHKTNTGPGLIVALGAPADDARKMGLNGQADSAVAAPLAICAPNGKSESRDLDSYDNINTDTVPVSLLSMPDDQEQMQPPEVGDVVNYQVTGKVVAIEGNYAKVQRESINGQDLPDAEPDETNGGNDNPQNANQSADADEGQSLRNDAAGIGMLS